MKLLSIRYWKDMKSAKSPRVNSHIVFLIRFGIVGKMNLFVLWKDIDLLKIPSNHAVA